MIILPEVAAKIQAILNGTDPETQNLTNPTDYEFVVATEGFHIDSIANPREGRNFIPVFISSMGGQFNPVKGLKQGSYSIPIVFYYPVRFKNDFFALGDFLVDAFVGTSLNYGAVSGRAISNISVPQYGEIQDLDFKEFREWTNAHYQRQIEVMEAYMSMQVNLYLSNAASGLIFGNDITASFSFSYNSHTYTINDIDFDGASLQSNSQAQSEQEEGTNEADSLPFGTAYGSSFKVYPNLEAEAAETGSFEISGSYSPTTEYYALENGGYVSVGYFTTLDAYNAAVVEYGALYTYTPLYFYKELLKVWLQGNIQEVECSITFTIAGDSNLSYTRECFIQSIVAPIEKGQLFSLTLTFTKKTSFEA